jgi:hypothetical protein
MTIPDAELAANFIPDVSALGVRYVRSSRAIKAVRITSHCVYTFANGNQWALREGTWVCRVIGEDNYFVMPDDVFQLLFQLPTS